MLPGHVTDRELVVRECFITYDNIKCIFDGPHCLIKKDRAVPGMSSMCISFKKGAAPTSWGRRFFDVFSFFV